MSQPTVAVIGSGISGLSAAWGLAHSHDVTLFEADDRPGGHANTVEMPTPRGPICVDTGFIVYNTGNYPNLTAFFRELSVPTAASEMSFALSFGGGAYEYCSSTTGFFDQPRNLMRRRHWRLFNDMRRFFKTAQERSLAFPPSTGLGEFLRTEGYSTPFTEDYILPMGAAIWSADMAAMLEFPARTFIDFYANHGLLGLTGQPSWRTVQGGSREYVSRILADRPIDLRTSTPVTAIRRSHRGVELRLANGEPARFDQVVLATHGDTSLCLLDDADREEQAILGAFTFQKNHAILHDDASVMPKRRRLWSSWNYAKQAGGVDESVSLTYWMNRLQPLKTPHDIFVSLNPTCPIDESRIAGTFTYDHPLFDADAIAAQSHIWSIQGRGGVWHAGAWLGYGFHEDGIEAGLAVAEVISPSFRRPWSVPKGSERIAQMPPTWAEAAE